MKVVDEKGRLFGKLNIIDLLVIILILAALAVVGLKVLGVGDDGGAPVTKVTYTVRVTAQDAQVAAGVGEYVDAGTGKKDQLMSNGNMLSAYVVDYWTEPTRYNRKTDGTIELLDAAQAEGVGLVDICFTIEADLTNTVINEVGSQEVRIGKPHIVKTVHLEFLTGIIESCAWEPAV